MCSGGEVREVGECVYCPPCLGHAVDSTAEVDHLHAIALGAGWSAVREPKKYPRFNDRYYASFVEDDNGIRLEFMYSPPRETVAG